VALGEDRFQVGAATPHVHSGLWELFSGRSTPETVPPPAAPAASLILQISGKIGKADQPQGLVAVIYTPKREFDVWQKSRLSIKTLVTMVGVSHLSYQKSKMPESSAVRHLDTIVAYIILGTWCTPSVKKEFASDN